MQISLINSDYVVRLPILLRLLSTGLVLVFVQILLLAGVSQAGNGQNSAVPLPKAEQSLFLDGAAVDDRLVIVGERGHILLSDDKGDSWRQSGLVPTRATLTAVAFFNSNFGLAVGHDAIILRTRDGGENWEMMFSAPDYQQPFLDVLVIDENSAFAVGAYGFFMTTIDGGETWEEARVNEEDDWHLNQVSRADNGKYYIAAEMGTLYRSDDNGKSWKTLPSPYPGSFYGVLPMEGDALLAYGLRGHLFSSRDAGESWQKIETNTTALLTNAIKNADGSVVFVGSAGTVLYGKEQPLNVKSVEQKNRRDLTSVIKLDAENLLTIGAEGVEKIKLQL